MCCSCYFVWLQKPVSLICRKSQTYLNIEFLFSFRIIEYSNNIFYFLINNSQLGLLIWIEKKQLVHTKLTPLSQTNCSDLSWTSMNNRIRQIVLSAPAGATTSYINNALYTNITNTFGSRGTWFLYNTQPSYSVNASYLVNTPPVALQIPLAQPSPIYCFVTIWVIIAS